jgi:hypothetical protein
MIFQDPLRLNGGSRALAKKLAEMPDPRDAEVT